MPVGDVSTPLKAAAADPEVPLVSGEQVPSYGTEPPAKTETKPKPSGHLYRTDIDGLRCVAVVAVIIYHIRSFLLPGGFLGVDVFFVISGFVVTGSLLGSPQETVGDYFAAFYARRLKRLTPALCLMVVVAAYLVPALMGYNTDEVDLQLYYESAQLASFGGANVLYALQKATYFDQQLKRQDFNPFLHCWSLGVEEQFYLVFPGLLLLLFPKALIKSFRTSSTDGKTESPTSFFLPVLALAMFMMISLVATSAAAVAAAEPDPAWSNFVFYLSPFRFWQLAIGALLFHGISERDAAIGGGWLLPVYRYVPAPVFAWTSLFILILGYIFDSSAASPLVQWVWAMLGVMSCVLFIMAGAPAGKDEEPRTMPFFNQVCCTTPFVYIGRTSYQLYLWHWPAILFAEKLDTRVDISGASDVAGVVAATFFALILGVGVPLLSYHVLEAPFRSWKTTHLKAIGAFLLMIAGSCLLIAILQLGLGQTIAVATAPGYVATPDCPEQGAIASFYNYIKDETADESISTAFGRNKEALGDTHCQCRFCNNVTTSHFVPPHLTDDKSANLCFSTYPGQSSLWKDTDCKLIIELDDKKNEDFSVYKDLMHKCLTPEPPEEGKHPNATMWLVGDSHAGALSAGLMEAVRYKYQLSFLYAPFGKDKVALFPRPPDLMQNEKLENKVYDELKKILKSNFKKGDVLSVMLVNFMWTEYKHQVQMEELLNSTIIPRKGKLLLFTDYKQQKMDVGFAHKQSAKIQQQLVDKFPKYVSLVDTYDLFDADCLDKDVKAGTCTEDETDIMVPGTQIPAYYNDDHFTTVGSIYLWPYLCSQMEDKGIM